MFEHWPQAQIQSRYQSLPCRHRERNLWHTFCNRRPLQMYVRTCCSEYLSHLRRQVCMEHHLELLRLGEDGVRLQTTVDVGKSAFVHVHAGYNRCIISNRGQMVPAFAWCGKPRCGFVPTTHTDASRGRRETRLSRSCAVRPTRCRRGYMGVHSTVTDGLCQCQLEILE